LQNLSSVAAARKQKEFEKQTFSMAAKPSQTKTRKRQVVKVQRWTGPHCWTLMCLTFCLCRFFVHDNS
jgi:hypothetical protein